MNSQQLISLLQKHQPDFSGVVSFDPKKNKLLQLDFTASNNELTDTILNDTRLFCDYINDKLRYANAYYGIGGYGEHRAVYSRSKLFDGTSASSLEEGEPRRLHLGTDIWGKPHTAVISPMDGIIHSFAFNDRPGD